MFVRLVAEKYFTKHLRVFDSSGAVLYEKYWRSLQIISWLEWLEAYAAREQESLKILNVSLKILSKTGGSQLHDWMCRALCFHLPVLMRFYWHRSNNTLSHHSPWTIDNPWVSETSCWNELITQKGHSQEVSIEVSLAIQPVQRVLDNSDFWLALRKLSCFGLRVRYQRSTPKTQKHHKTLIGPKVVGEPWWTPSWHRSGSASSFPFTVPAHTSPSLLSIQTHHRFTSN